MHHQRKKSYVNAIDDFFILGSQMKQRDTKPVRKTVSGLIKLMHPDGNYTKEDVRQYLEFAIEMRRRVKEQLKRIGGMEFWDTNFSYIDKETQEETFVTLPEERGSNLIEDVPLAPGTCYTATSDGDKNVLVPMDNLQELANLPASILGKTDVPFYSSSQMLIQKIL